ncbi:SPOR domain-containing protein [bacterium]|nr:SPOR domain-containing protein [bacterium]
MSSAPAEGGGGGGRRPARLVAGCLLLALAVPAAAGPWPTPPRAAGVSVGKLPPAEARDYRFAAGFYQALTRELGVGDVERLADAEAERLGRALLSQGEGSAALRLLARRRDLSPSLGLLLALTSKPATWSSLERERWREAFAADDAESLYWRARVAQALGETARARQVLGDLLRREPGAVFAPAALELMQGLPESAPRAGAAPEGAAPSAARGTDLRVQWGVFQEAPGARRLLSAIQAYGQAAELVPGLQGGQTLYRVCSPAFASETEARALGEQLRLRYGLDYVLFRPAPANAAESGARR